MCPLSPFQHVLREHAPRYVRCRRCGLELRMEDALQEHYRPLSVCRPPDWPARASSELKASQFEVLDVNYRPH